MRAGPKNVCVRGWQLRDERESLFYRNVPTPPKRLYGARTAVRSAVLSYS